MRRIYFTIKFLNFLWAAICLIFALTGLYLIFKTEGVTRLEYIISDFPNWIYLIFISTGLIANWKSIVAWSWIIYLGGGISAILFGYFNRDVYYYFSIPFFLIMVLIIINLAMKRSMNPSSQNVVKEEIR